MNNQDNGSNGGILSKFRERLRKIKISRIKKKEKNEIFVQEKVKEIREVLQKDSSPIYYDKKKKGIAQQPETNIKIVQIPKDSKVEKSTDLSQVIVHIRSTAKDRNYQKKKVGIDSFDKDSAKELEPTKVLDGKKVTIVKDKKPYSGSISKEVLSPQKEETAKKDAGISNVVNNPVKSRKKGYAPVSEKKQVAGITDAEKEKMLATLGADILEKIKESFEDKLDELEVLESELYFLKKNQDNELELKKVKDIKKKIDELIEQVNHIIGQYNLYKNNYYIDNVIGLDDSVLVDDIINYRELLDSFSEEKKFVKEYKALEEFQHLYHHLKEVRDETERLMHSNEDKIEDFEIRDKKYDAIKLGIVPVQEIDKKCSLEIERQNQYFKDLMSKIHIIDREEYVTRHMRGIGDLLGQSLRYMGLMVLSPLRGLIPGIAVETMNTRRMIGNIYQNLHMEEVRHVHYDAINYDSELNHHLTDVGYTENLLEGTLRDVERLKEDFMRQYDSRIPGYESTLKKIQMIENKIIHNQHRVEVIKNNLKKSKKLNEDKMIKVKKLNENHHNS